MVTIGGVDLGNLPLYLFFFADGRIDANWQGATKGFVGDVAVDGIQASERTSGGVPYAGTIYTNDVNLGAWQNIINQNIGQATGVTNQVARIAGLEADLISAIQQINALPATPGYESVSSTSLDGLNTTNGINEVFVINITSGLGFSSKIDITGDPGDVFILRWDEDGDPSNGYQGTVKPQSGGAIVPHGGLTPTNFINVAGVIDSSGGGTNPAPPYPQGPRFDDGQGALIAGGSDFNGGGFFTGYWLTTGAPDVLYTGPGADPDNPIFFGEMGSLSNGIFVGGWYTLTTKFSMTSGTSGVYVSPNPATLAEPGIDLEKFVSVDGGVTWDDADNPPGPILVSPQNPRFRFVVTNTGNEVLNNVVVTDTDFGLIATIPSLNPGQSFEAIIIAPFQLGQHANTATATGTGADSGTIVTDSDSAHYVGVEILPAIDVEKFVSPDNGVTWIDADTPPGPIIISPQNPKFRFVVTNTGQETLLNVQVNDTDFGLITTIPSLAPGASAEQVVTGTWAAGQHSNVATATGVGQISGVTVTDEDPAFYYGPAPAIDIEKLVSVDGGITFVDADVAPGPTLNRALFPDVLFRFVITNTGIETLNNINVNDDVYGSIGTVPSLDPGDSFTFNITEQGQPGQHVNTATATGVGDISGITVTDSDSANYVGTELTIAIDLEKFVSPDDGITWFDADTPPGPTIIFPQNPVFRFVITNTGQETLNNVIVTDTDFGLVLIIGELLPGESEEHFVTGTWAAGQHFNNATATGTGAESGQQVTDEDPAYYFGPEPSIDIEKLVSVDGGVTFVDADIAPGPTLNRALFPNVQFKFVVTNTGNEQLINIDVFDNVYGPIIADQILDPGQSFEVDLSVLGTVGDHENTATVIGVGAESGQPVTDNDAAHYVGTQLPLGIDVEKFVSPDGGVTWFDADVPTGPMVVFPQNPEFKFVITNTGDEPLNNVTVTDSVFGVIVVIGQLLPGASDVHFRTGVWAPGQHFNVTTATGTGANGEEVTDTDPAFWFGIEQEPNPSITIQKLVSVDNGITFVDANTSPGPLLPPGVTPKFKYIVTNTGNVPLQNVTVTDNVLGLITVIPVMIPGEVQEIIVP